MFHVNLTIDSFEDFAIQENARSELAYVLGFAKGYILESLRYPARHSETKLRDSNGNSIGRLTVSRCAEFSQLLESQESGRRIRAPERIDTTELEAAISSLSENANAFADRESDSESWRSECVCECGAPLDTCEGCGATFFRCARPCECERGSE